jgi:hypothetical protein
MNKKNDPKRTRFYDLVKKYQREDKGDVMMKNKKGEMINDPEVLKEEIKEQWGSIFKTGYWPEKQPQTSSTCRCVCPLALFANQPNISKFIKIYSQFYCFSFSHLVFSDQFRLCFRKKHKYLPKNV